MTTCTNIATKRSSKELDAVLTELAAQWDACEQRLKEIDAEAGRDYMALAAGRGVSEDVQKRLDHARDHARALASAIEAARTDLIAAKERELIEAGMAKRAELQEALLGCLRLAATVDAAIDDMATSMRTFSGARISVLQLTPSRQRGSEQQVTLSAEWKHRLTSEHLMHIIRLGLHARAPAEFPYDRVPPNGYHGTFAGEVTTMVREVLQYFDHVHNLESLSLPGTVQPVDPADAANEALIAAAGPLHLTVEV